MGARRDAAVAPAVSGITAALTLPAIASKASLAEPGSQRNATFPLRSSSPSISKHWEAELAALKGNNAKLTAALLESTANVKQWKQQLAAYQEEAERLHKRVSACQSVAAQLRLLVSDGSARLSALQVTELECVSGHSTATRSQKTELSRTAEELEEALKAKEEVRCGSGGQRSSHQLGSQLGADLL